MLTFLQISDIHFRSDPGENEEALDYELRELLIEDARSAAEQVGGVSGVLVCGDLAHKGAGSEFAQASTWLQSLCSAIGVPPWMVWVVPGNHDIDHTRIGETQLELRARLREDNNEVAEGFAAIVANDVEREALLAPLYNYMEFASAYDCSIGSTLHWSEDFDLQGAQLQLRGLNSAMLCGKDDDIADKRMVIGDMQADIAVQNGVLYYTLCHHPPCWLMDREEVESWFQERVHVRVTGHLHVRQLTQTSLGVHLRAGAVSPERVDGRYVEPRTPRYELISACAVETGGNPQVDIIIRSRRWSESEQAWIADSEEDGTFAYRCELGVAGAGLDISLPPTTSAMALEYPRRELRYRLAQLQSYDRLQCAREIEAPLEDVVQAPAHLQVAIIFEWAQDHGRLDNLRQAVTRTVRDPQQTDSSGADHA